ncbi:DUF1348 family protein [Nocardioides astragali]|uniref:DUF1348 family protein n=1 Tax=Nocardioides astragali TaxID=1776736 RepID=A0ABW2N166_9ACTN|nr:DUF1348 family protein [Nocardioides astragali]
MTPSSLAATPSGPAHRKWKREQDYALLKSLWGFHDNRIAVRFQYEWHDHAGQWFRSYGNELWEFDEDGLMRRREASINDTTINEADRRWFGPRPEHERGIEFWTHQDIPLRLRWPAKWRPSPSARTPLFRGSRTSYDGSRIAAW